MRYEESTCRSGSGSIHDGVSRAVRVLRRFGQGCDRRVCERCAAAGDAAGAREGSVKQATIADCPVTADYSGETAIVVTYTFTNNSDKATAFFTAVSAKAFQNGVQLDTGIVQDIDAQSSINEIKSGATTTVQQAYLLDDQSEVSVECTELISFDDTVIAEKTFSVV